MRIHTSTLFGEREDNTEEKNHRRTIRRKIKSEATLYKTNFDLSVKVNHQTDDEGNRAIGVSS